MSDRLRRHRRAALPRLLTGGVARVGPPRLRIHRAEPPTLWRRIRSLAGWIVLAVGLLGIVMPLNPASLVIPAGVALIGRHHPVIRWGRTRGKLLLRASAGWPSWLGRCGALARDGERRLAKLLRDRRLGKWRRPGPAGTAATSGP